MRLTTSPPSCAECHVIWEPKTPGNLWATSGLLGDSFTFTIINVDMSARNYTLFLSDFHETCIFSADFQNALEYQVSLKTVQWGPSCSLRTDKQSQADTEM